MERDIGPSFPYHVLLTSPEQLSTYLRALQALLVTLEPEQPVRLEVSESVRNFGFGPCRVSQVVIYWNPARSTFGEPELLLYARALALALGCELIDLYAVPQNTDLIEPETLQVSAARAPDPARLPRAIKALQTEASRQTAAKL